MLRQKDPTACVLGLLLAAAGAGGAPAAGSQPVSTPPPTPPDTTVASQPGPHDITGRDFAGLRIAGSTQVTDLTLSGARAWIWTEDVPAGSRRSPTQRLLLRGDARVELGLYRFTAAQAAVWIERLGPSPTDPEGGLYQVAIYFDRVSDPGAQAGTAQTADRLLVTGILDGVIRTQPAADTRSRPVEKFLKEAEERLARLLRKIAGEAAEGPAPAPAQDLEQGIEPGVPPGEPGRQERPGAGPINPGVSRPFEPDSAMVEPDLPGQPAQRAPPAERLEPIFAERGILTFAFQTLRLVHAGEDNAVILPDGVVVHYSDPRTGRSMEMSAERAVVFTEPGAWGEGIAGGAEGQGVQVPAGKVRGVFLEGNVVATGRAREESGQYTLRGPRVYYDVQNDRALVVDAVFWTYDEQRRLPLYVRAKSIKQLARNQWLAKNALVATTSFFDPHFSLGVSSVTVTKASSGRTLVDAKDVVLRAGGLPFFYLPRMRGDVGHFPLREIRVEGTSGSGAALKTSWDLFTLLGVKHPEHVGAHVLIDGYFERGPALGTLVDWEDDASNGHLFAYSIINDDGTDQLSSGAHVEVNDETRGVVVGEHRWRIDEHWSAWLEAGYVSDERFIDSFFRWMGQSRREFTNAAYVRNIADNGEFSLIAKGEINDFTPNQYLLQSQGYATDKLPEAYYARVNDDVLSGAAPGLISYSSEYRLSRMNLNFVEPTAAELGFDTPARAAEAFGLLPNQSLGDRLRAQGFTESAVLRADTRQELSMPLKAGPVNLTPFAVGRATAYDRDFSDFSPDATDQVRLWGAAGARIGTSLQTINDNMDSRFLDLHRTRHIIEPSVTVWTAGTNLHQEDLPVYDDSVESIASGSAVRAGVTQTWQTQRGGAGRWHSVDVLKIAADVVFSTDDADRESPIGHFYDWRPEYSLLGDYGALEAAWQVSDAMALSFNTVYDFETHQPARTGTGIIVQHSEDFSASAELRYLNARDITLLDVTLTERLTPRYLVSGQVTFDTDEREIQWVGGTLRRRFAQTTIGLTVRYNNISGETGIGVVIEPAGVYAARDELRRRLGRETGVPVPSVGTE